MHKLNLMFILLLVGVLRCAAFSGARNRSLYVPDDKSIENITQEEYLNKNADSSAIGHFHGIRSTMEIIYTRN